MATIHAQEEGFRLLSEGKIKEFNRWRMMPKNLIIKLDFSGRSFSDMDISGALLNGIIADKASFDHAKSYWHKFGSGKPQRRKP